MERLLPLLRRCAGLVWLKRGTLIHQKVITLGLQDNVAIRKSLVDFYLSCQLIESAKLVFETIENPPDISLWNGLIAAYAKRFMFAEALELFQRLLGCPSLRPDFYTYPTVLKACGALRRGDCGCEIQARLIKNGSMLDIFVASSVVGMYAKCSMFKRATQVFDEMPDRDVASWNAVISCSYQDGQWEKALELFEKMKDQGYEPNTVTFTVALSSCARLLDLERGKRVHEELLRAGFIVDGFVHAALVNLYGKCGCLEIARQVFEQVPAKTLISWNSMIAAHSLEGNSTSCIVLLQRMIAVGIRPCPTSVSSSLMACSKSANLRHGKFIHGYVIRNDIELEIYVRTSLLDLYFKCGNVASAELFFEKLPKTSVVEWNAVISGYVSMGLYVEALNIYADMKDVGMKPNGFTFTSILVACSQLAALERGKEIHEAIVIGNLQYDEKVMGALLDMYAKCGAVNQAFEIFEHLPEKDLASWTSMITAYGSHGQSSKAVELFMKMQKANIKPDRIAFLAVISACAHARLVNEGCYFFNLMITDYGIEPTAADYSCLIDLLGRAGRLSEAYSILRRTPMIREDVEILSTLLSACLLNRDFKLGEKVASLLIEKDPEDPSAYVALANMYASILKWDRVSEVRLQMKELGFKKFPGCTWIEVDKRIEPFFVEDKLIRRADVVYECLSILAEHMEKDELPVL